MDTYFESIDEKMLQGTQKTIFDQFKEHYEYNKKNPQDKRPPLRFII